MFNGIIYNTGKVFRIEKRKNGLNIFLKSPLKISKKNIGDSISCDGVCLTLVSYKNKILEFYLSNETLIKSKFRKIKLNDDINIELPLKFGQNISGHICQGHVDTVGKVRSIKKVDISYVYKFKVKKKYIKYLIEKASILINGVSLTISKVKSDNFEIWIIPHTLKLTNLKKLKKNSFVNIEIDILSKYVKKFLNEKK